MAEKVRFFNTMARKVQEFESINPDKVGLYTCGPTVYNFAHIGNFRAYTFEDILCRTLRLAGYDYAISIEHEDSLMSGREGLSKAIECLKESLIFEDKGEMYWA